MARDRKAVTSYLEDLDAEAKAQRCGPGEEIFLRPDCHPSYGLFPVYRQVFGCLVFMCARCGQEWGPRVVVAHDPKRAN